MTLSRLVITTGGTGGHIFPALAVAHEARRRNPSCSVLFLGGSGPERELAKKADIEFRELPAKGVMGRGVKGILGGIGWLGKGLTRAMGELRRFRPEAVIGFGGYAGFCPVLAAWLLRIPSAVHEQNSYPGVTNRALGRLVKRVFLSFEDKAGMFPATKTRLTGNPVRETIFKAREDDAERPGRHLLVLGGSQGAKPLNDAVVAALPALLKAGITLTHQAGRQDEERVREAYAKAGADPQSVKGFIEDMTEAYRHADMVLARAGASTVFELAAAGKPSALVPFPYATHDHQTANARAIEAAGGSVVVPQPELEQGWLKHNMESMFDSGRLAEMGRNAAGFAKPDAASDIVDGLEAIASSRR
ncbi:undecaprenyldiphospho-muramoylpentapeptide beta-N-acetylglucosaminyltransferase [Desulfovibrio oxyclinae]|uniref:undecaprenyldiphospho-muramoylpentapeptide beta-N-acetylglucosaminyltransferase n=1 Tax=Desulfovibrio oxyclinae TaxID=63560 RepID=UPI000369D7CB|nr:undecaprenyldiphospho-muramoylpentapeptide beta-N-acetylglucosaminyltransferase [Desulfovibrio oxyclinae]